MNNKSVLALLGQSQHVDIAGNTTYIRDPFSATMFQFVRYCLQNTAKALHHTVVFAYKNQSGAGKKHFFLTGYKERTGWHTLQRKVYGDPTVCCEGLDIKWLLKNLRWHWKEYALQMNLYDDVFDDITGFLLFDIIQKGFVDFEENNITFDAKFVADCFDACLELVSAVMESDFYKNISETVGKIKLNIDLMLTMLPEFDSFIKKQDFVLTESLDTRKVLHFLKDDSLMKELKREEKLCSDNPTEKPLTNFFMFTVMPRFDEHQLTSCGDSGVVADDVSSVSSNVSMDSSMVIIDQFQSTPVVPRNKALERIKAKSLSASKNNRGKSEHMDGSFVLL